MKHEREMTHKWRLKKTLKRRTQIRPVEPDDMKYLWASYKKGALASMGKVFENQDMNAEEFQAAFEAVAQDYTEGWIILAETKKGFIPAAFAVGKMDKVLPFMVIVGMAWFPWATKRNIVEGTVAFLDSLRRVVPCLWFAVDEHKRLYEICCMHGIVRRIGTSQIAIPGRAAAVFETRF